MVDWELISRSGARYTVLYGGGTAGVVALTGQSLFALLLIIAGLLLLLFVAGGMGTVRMGTIIGNDRALGIADTMTNPVENDEFAEAVAADLKLFFYAIGLVGFGFAALVVMSGV